MNTKGKMMLGAYLGFAVGCLVWVMNVFAPAIIFGGQFGRALVTIFKPSTTTASDLIIPASVFASVFGSLVLLVVLGVGFGAGIGRLTAIMTNKSPEKT